MINPLKIFLNFIARLLSKIKCKCNSSCCACQCDSISAEEYRDIMIAAIQMTKDPSKYIKEISHF